MKRLFEAFLIFSSSLLVSWLFFLPIFWDLASNSPTIQDGIFELFFSSKQHKLLGGGIDQIGTVWMFGMVEEMLLGERNTFVSQLYHPIGFDLGQNTGYAWADIWVSFPIIQWLGVPGFYHLHILLTLTLTMSVCAALCRAAGAPLPIAIALSSLSILNPFVIQEIYQGRPTQVYLLFHGLFLISLLKTSLNPRYLWSCIGGIALAGSVLTYWFGGAATGFAGAIGFILTLPQSKKWKKSLAHFVLMGCLGIFIAIAITWPVSSAILKGSGSSIFTSMRSSPQLELDLVIFKIPIQWFQHLNSAQDLIDLLKGFKMNSLWWPLIIATLCFPVKWTRRLPWTIALIVAIGFPLPPGLSWTEGWMFTGHALLQSVFSPVTRCHVPERMIVAPLLISLILISKACSCLYSLKSPLLKMIVVLSIGASIGLLSLENRPVRSDTNTGMFVPNKKLIQATNIWSGGIIDVPLLKSQHSYVQILYHNAPILGGPGLDSVRPQKHRRYVQRNSFLRMVEDMAEKGKQGAYTSKSLSQLIDDGFGILAVHQNLSRSSLDAYRELCNHEGIWDSRQKVLYLPLPKLEQP